MTDIEQKTLVERLRIIPDQNGLMYGDYEDVMQAADLIEQHEAFRQEVSDAILRYLAPTHVPHGLKGFIIPATKPDPLVAACNALNWDFSVAEELRTILDALGFEIREKNDEN